MPQTGTSLIYFCSQITLSPHALRRKPRLLAVMLRLQQLPLSFLLLAYPQKVATQSSGHESFYLYSASLISSGVSLLPGYFPPDEYPTSPLVTSTSPSSTHGGYNTEIGSITSAMYEVPSTLPVTQQSESRVSSSLGMSSPRACLRV
jgi:hypothetical protein